MSSLLPRVAALALGWCAVFPAGVAAQQPPPIDPAVEWQPLAAQARRLVEALEYLGEPLSPGERAGLAELTASPAPGAVARIQEVLDRRVLFTVHINPEMRVKVAQGPADPRLVEQGWRQFLVKVLNESGTTAPLEVVSPHGRSVHNARRLANASDRQYGPGEPPGPIPPEDRWLEVQTFDAQPLRPALGGLPVEYRVVQIYSRDAGRREGRFGFNVGQGTQDIGFRNEVDVLFTCLPAREIRLRVRDERGGPATASFTVRDGAGRVYPSRAKRLAPDFAFHPQVYRRDGEVLRLPDGEYEFRVERGPESIPEVRRVVVDAGTSELAFDLRRWIDPSRWGWWSGDHHIHAAGCAHYSDPTEGVLPADMVRHTEGEDLKVGATLTWGPGFDYQKQFFSGEDHPVSSPPYLLHYDIEVSGFGSYRTGHLCLLRLKEQMYPGGDSSAHWPTLGLNIIRWAKRQGAVVGPAHSGWGLQPAVEDERTPGISRTSGSVRLATEELPNFVVPPFNGIGANEYIMNVAHEVPGPDGAPVPAIDFLSVADTPSVWELNIWYHTLNAGFRTRVSGETDFPCIYGERVGLGRSYVKLDGALNYDDWCEGIRRGRSYVGDGKSHLLELAVEPAEGPGAEPVRLGEGTGELRLAAPGTVRVRVRAAARLGETPDERIRGRRLAEQPYWDLERARIGDGREVPVEVVVNGRPVARQVIVADGALRDLEFTVPVERSSWLAVRILPSSHTNPVWVMVGDRPVRASRRSIEWCLAGLERCWAEKRGFYAEAEMAQAVADYEQARAVYRRRLAEAEVD